MFFNVFIIQSTSVCILPSLQVLERAADFGSGLITLGNKSSQDTFIGIYAINRAEVWLWSSAFQLSLLHLSSEINQMA